MEEQLPKKKDQILLYLLLVVTLAWGIFWILMIHSSNFAKDSTGWAERGQFGDMFGALNALFSGLAFAGIIYTIRQQKEELELQREELRLTRRELTKSAEAQKKSEEALNSQANTMRLTALLNAYSSLIAHHRYVNESGFFESAERHVASELITFYSKKIVVISKRLENPADSFQNEV
jgi:hypothetical protein